MSDKKKSPSKNDEKQQKVKLNFNKTMGGSPKSPEDIFQGKYINHKMVDNIYLCFELNIAYINRDLDLVNFENKIR